MLYHIRPHWVMRMSGVLMYFYVCAGPRTARLPNQESLLLSWSKSSLFIYMSLRHQGCLEHGQRSVSSANLARSMQQYLRQPASILGGCFERRLCGHSSGKPSLTTQDKQAQSTEYRDVQTGSGMTVPLELSPEFDTSKGSALGFARSLCQTVNNAVCCLFVSCVATFLLVFLTAPSFPFKV